MKKFLDRWHADKLNTLVSVLWLLTVFFSFLGGDVLQFRIPGVATLFPFRVLLPVTTLLYLIRAIVRKQNPWKTATFIQRLCYILCGILAVYGTASLAWAIDLSFSAPVWFTMCFDLVFFALGIDLCRDRKLFTGTVCAVAAAIVVQILPGIYEVFCGGILKTRFDGIFWMFGRTYTSPTFTTGNPNDYAMGLVFMLAVLLLYWAWQGHGEKGFRWIPVLLAPVYFLICTTYGRLCMVAFWILVAGIVLFALTGKKTRGVLIAALLLLGVTVGVMHVGESVPMPWEDAQQVSSDPDNLKDEFFVVDEQTGETQLNLSLSGGIRVDLLLHSMDCFLQSKGMGVGLGNTAQLAKVTAARRDNIWAIHCFLARMSADFGIWFLIPLLLIAFKMLQFGVGYAIRGLRGRSWQNALLGAFYLAAILVFPVASTASGDAQNSLAMWLYLAAMVVLPAHIEKTSEL